MKNLFIITPMVLLAACATVTAPTPNPVSPMPAQYTCDAGQYNDLIGQNVTSLERVMILGQVRVIRPGSAVTADFRPDRINFNVDEANRITSIHCA